MNSSSSFTKSKAASNSNGMKVLKLPKQSQNKTASATFYGRDEKVDADRYYKLLEENKALKKRIQELELKIKQQEVALKRSGGSTPAGSANLDSTGISSDYETLKIENTNLKDKNLKMKKIITSLQKDLKKRGIKSTYKFYPSQYELADYIRLIEHLQNSLNEAHEDRRTLLSQLSAFKETKASQAITEYSNDISQKNIQLSELTVKYEQLIRNFDANVKILELTKQSLTEYMEKYTVERNKNFDLETQLRLQQTNLDKVEEYLATIEDYKVKEKQLEERIADLCENPFIKQANERGMAFAKLKESEIALAEIQRRFKVCSDQNLEYQNKIKELEEKMAEITKERDILKEDSIRYKLSNEEREKQNKLFEEQFRRMAQFGKVDSNFDKMLDLLRGESKSQALLTGEQQSNKDWNKLEFFEDKKNENASIDDLKAENEKLRVEKGILGEELERTKQMLLIETNKNNDYLALSECNEQKYKKTVKLLNDKIKELLILIEKEKIPQEYLNYQGDDMVNNLLKSTESQDVIAGLKGTKEPKLIKKLDDKITEFSVSATETEYAIDENSMDLYIGKATFDTQSLENLLGILPRNLLSFLSVDFYLHETQTSNLVSGSDPNYNFQLSFRVYTDDHFLRYIKDDHLIIEIYYLKENAHIIFASGKIALNQLIKAESNTRSRVVKGLCQIYSTKDNSIVLGSIKYKMRMRFSIQEALYSINERLKLTKEISPMEEINMKMMGEMLTGEPDGGLIEYKDVERSNKVYNVNIHISKAENIKLLGNLRKINPYLYYSFFKMGEHYSSISSGTNPEFQDSVKYTVIYTAAFHDYIEKEYLDVFIFDSSKPIQVDVGNDVELDKNNDSSDLLGICHIKLRELLMNNKIDGYVPIESEDGKNVVGNLAINIFWEEVKI